jgi:hypothetical protein
MTILTRVSLIIGAVLGAAAVMIAGAYWWANVPPKRPQGVSSNAVFLWAGHLGLPAPKHGTWIECWTDIAEAVNKCRLTEMNGTLGYEGVFQSNSGKTPVPQSDLRIEGEPASDTTHWVRLHGLQGAPLVFLSDGTVLIPKDAYQEGLAKLENLRREQGRNHRFKKTPDERPSAGV